jgi:hypothetical protein
MLSLPTTPRIKNVDDRVRDKATPKINGLENGYKK